MSPEDIIAMSAVEVFEDEIFTQKRGDETPLEHGPMDLRMGSTDKGTQCFTCNNTYKDESSIDGCPVTLGISCLLLQCPTIYSYKEEGIQVA